jgi:P27 family predicted phage terminase small subunit
MAAGRKPDPGRERRGTGNRPAQGARRAPRAAPELEPPELEGEEAAPSLAERFPPPASLPEWVHGRWRDVIEDLGGSDHMRVSYLPAIEAYCAAIAVHAEATQHLRENGLIVLAENGPRANPMIRVQKDAAATILRFADALGMTPAGRIRLGLMEVAGKSILLGIQREIQRAVS